MELIEHHWFVEDKRRKRIVLNRLQEKETVIRNFVYGEAESLQKCLILNSETPTFLLAILTGVWWFLTISEVDMFEYIVS